MQTAERLSYRQAMRAARRAYWIEIGNECGWNISQMARRARYPRASIYPLLATLEVRVPPILRRVRDGGVIRAAA